MEQTKALPPQPWLFVPIGGPWALFPGCFFWYGRGEDTGAAFRAAQLSFGGLQAFACAAQAGYQTPAAAFSCLLAAGGTS